MSIRLPICFSLSWHGPNAVDVFRKEVHVRCVSPPSSMTYHSMSLPFQTLMSISDIKIGRRSILSLAALLAAATVLPTSRSSEALAAMYSTDTVQDKKYRAAANPNATLEDLMPQVRDGLGVLQDLQARWTEKTAALDGDVIRRILGTVGVTSPLFGIRKVFLRVWQIVSDSTTDYDLVDRMESEWNGVLDGISNVDFQVYSVGFTELLETKLNLLAKSKEALDRTIQLYEQFVADIPADLQ